MSRSGSEQISARGKSHGLSRSGYPPLRNVTDRCGLGNPLRNNPDYGLYFNPYTSLEISEKLSSAQPGEHSHGPGKTKLSIRSKTQKSYAMVGIRYFFGRGSTVGHTAVGAPKNPLVLPSCSGLALKNDTPVEALELSLIHI